MKLARPFTSSRRSPDRGVPASAPTLSLPHTNREQPPDFINIKVEELAGDRPFDNLDKYITQDELRALSESYKRVAGFALADVVD
jgi:5-methylphenazine-1-carboxylate 1-monooxygenase